MSIYKGELTNECLVKNALVLKKSFPALKNDFIDIFYERLKANGYTDQRLNDAIGHVIDNCIYPTPTIAQFISFDRKMILYNHNDMLKINDTLNGKAFESHKAVKIGNNTFPMWAHVNDIETYKLQPWIN